MIAGGKAASDLILGIGAILSLAIFCFRQYQMVAKRQCLDDGKYSIDHDSVAGTDEPEYLKCEDGIDRFPSQTSLVDLIFANPGKRRSS